MAKEKTTVTVTSTDLDIHHKTGATWETTPQLAAWMAKKGLVTYEGQEIAAEAAPADEEPAKKKKK